MAESSNHVVLGENNTDSSTRNGVVQKNTIVVTGFGPFSVHKINPSWLAVKELDRIGLRDDVNLVIHQLPVEYETVKKEVPLLWKKHSPKLVVHCGVSGVAQVLTLEQAAHNLGYKSADIQGLTPQDLCCVDNGPENLISGLHMGRICEIVNNANCDVTAVVSHDAGRYLCDFTYFISLNIAKQRTAFIHVPPENNPYTIKQLGKGLQIAINAMLDQLEEFDSIDDFSLVTSNSLPCL